jgi:hypothetical protein
VLPLPHENHEGRREKESAHRSNDERVLVSKTFDPWVDLEANESAMRQMAWLKRTNSVADGERHRVPHLYLLGKPGVIR